MRQRVQRSLADRTARIRRRSEHNRYQWGPSLLVGGGMDYDLPFMDHRFGLRLFQADYRYIHTDYGPAVESADRLATWAAARTWAWLS